MPFDQKTLERLALAKEVDIIVGDDGPVVIWVVLVGSDVYVRSYLGMRGRWFRHLVKARKGVLRAGRTRIPVRATLARSERAIADVSLAFQQKYSDSGSLRSMLTPETLPTTIRLDPV